MAPILFGLVLGILVFSGSLWGGIKIFEPHNPRNKFVTALAIGFVFSLFGLGGGIFMPALSLVLLLYLLFQYYDLDTMPAIGVIVLMIVVRVGLSVLLNAIVGMMSGGTGPPNVL